MKTLYIALASVAICLAGLCFWWFGFGRHVHFMDKLVSESAVLVLELKKGNYISQPDSIFPQTVQQTSLFQESRTNWVNLLKLAASLGADTGKIKSAPVWFSVHTGNENKPEWVCYLPEIDFGSNVSAFEKLKATGFRFSVRSYQGMDVLEWTPEKQGESFAITQVNGVWVLSHSGYLVDEVIRTHHAFKWTSDMVGTVKSLPEFKAESPKNLYWYIQPKQIPEWAAYYFKPSFTPFFTNYFSGAYLGGNFELQGKNVVLTGFSTETKSKNDNMPISAAWPVVASGNYLVTYKTAFLTQNLNPLGFPQFQKSQIANLSPVSIQFAVIEHLQKNEKLLTLTGPTVPALFEDLRNAHDEAKKEDSLLLDLHNNQVIMQLPQSAWNLLGTKNKLGAMIPCYVALSGNEILCSSQVLLLRKWLDKIGAATSHRPDQARNAQIHLDFKMHKGLSLLKEQLLAKQIKGFNQDQDFFKNWDNLELMHQNNRIQIRLAARTSTSDTVVFDQLARVNVGNSVTRFWPYPKTPGLEQAHWVVCQLNNNQLLRLGPKGEVLWKTLLPEQASTYLQLLDLSTKGNYGLLLAAGKYFDVRNELGASISGFPKMLPDTLPVELVSAWDYDGKKDYRLVAVSRYGDVFASATTGTWLPGWAPLSPGDKLTFPPRHFRVGDKDFILLALQSGRIELRNRKGEMQPGFPMEMGNRLVDDYLLEPGLSTNQTYIYVLTLVGEVLKINLEGEKISSQQLYRPERETKFRFCLDQDRTSFCTVRQVPGKLTVFDQNYKSLFDWPTEHKDWQVQYFRFGSFGKIFCLTDPVKKETFILDEGGKLLNKTALPGAMKTNFIPLEDNGVFKLATAKDSLIYFYKMTLP